MTQFILIEATENIQSDYFTTSAIDPNDNFMMRAAHGIFAEKTLHNVRSLKLKNTDFDGIFTSSKTAMNEGLPFRNTCTSQLLESLSHLSLSIALWYSDDYTELPVTRDFQVFLREVEAGLNTDSVECYIHFIK